MIQTIKIGEKDISFKASAASYVIYKRVFHNDLLLEMSTLAKFEDKSERASALNDIVSQMAYVFYCEANLSNNELFNKLNLDSYILWLSDFDINDIIEKSKELLDLYKGNAKTSSKSKND